MRSTISRLGKYDLKTVIARTATSVIYDGWDADIARRVAVKVILASAVGSDEDPDSLARFKRGAQAAGQLTHPNIVGVYDYGESGDHAYIVMEYIDGPTLKARFDNKQPFSMATVLKVVGEILQALQYSHDRGVVHRDMKPANIMFTADGRLKITDFGIARIEDSSMTQTGIVIGTPAYMSPEQFTGEKIDWRTDIYSTGAILYEMLTGERPYEGNLATIMHKTLYTPPPRPSRLSASVTPALDQIVTRAMAKKREDRFQSATEFNAALQAIQAPNLSGLHRPLGPSVATSRPARQIARQSRDRPILPYWKPAGAAACIAVVTIAAGWYMLSPTHSRMAPTKPDRLETAAVAPKTTVTDNRPTQVLPPLPTNPPEDTTATALPAMGMKSSGSTSDVASSAERPPVFHNDGEQQPGDSASANLPTSSPLRLSPDLPDVVSLPTTPWPKLPAEMPKPTPRRVTDSPSFPNSKPGDTVLRQKNPPSQTRPGGQGPEPSAISNGTRGDSNVSASERMRTARLLPNVPGPNVPGPNVPGLNVPGPNVPRPNVPGMDPRDGLLPNSLVQKTLPTPPQGQANPGPARYATTSINGALGLVCQTITPDTAAHFGLDAARGMVVTGVLVGSAADNAGIRRDDVIVKVNGSEVSDASSLSSVTAQASSGGAVPVELLRAGTRHTVQIRIEQPRS